jgi:type II secretory pathway pseudopilin PulG
MHRPAEAATGFTLLEMVIVITVIFVLAAAIGWKSSATLSGERLSSATEQVKSDIRYVQALAMAQKAAMSVTWVSGSSTYTIPNNPSGSQTKRLILGVAFDTPAFSSLSFDSVGEPTGTCASGCSIQLRYLSATTTIAISPYTGYAG